MVAVIKSGVSIRKTFFYNENKVGEGIASLLMVANYPMEMEQMNQHQRLNMLLKTAEKNPNVRRPCLHISLNFAPGEEPSQALLKQLTTEYMQAIGLGDQPYLVFEHFDAAHPHVHIVSLRVRPDGTTIDTYGIGQNQSEAARKMLEEKYNLVRAEDHKRDLFKLPPVNVSKVIYSKSETKRSISNVLNWVLKNYRFTSLASLNAVLKGYNIHADRGTEQSRIFKNGGLVYCLLGENGKLLSVPIPASDFYIPVLEKPGGASVPNKDLFFHPTLKYLEKVSTPKSKFTLKERERIKTAIDFFLQRHPDAHIDDLEKGLLKQNIRMALHRNATGRLYGITYIDLQNRFALNGSDLGTAYSSNAIQQRCGGEKSISIPVAPQAPELSPTRPVSPEKQPASYPQAVADPLQNDFTSSNSGGLLEILMEPENVYEPLPYELRRKKKRRKKK
jgi:hypothetical protein